jgi:hypothetical protein
MINNHRNTSYRRQYCGIIDNMKGQLTNRYSEILKLRFVSRLAFGMFKHCSEHFRDSTY